MGTLYELREPPELAEPTLLLAMTGWVDAGAGAQVARESLVEHLSFTEIATFDVDLLVDHRSNRPVMTLEDGVHKEMAWPSITLSHATDSLGNELLLLDGAEPDHLWRRFTSEVVELATQLGVTRVFSIGAYPAPVPHTRATELSSTSTTEELAQSIGAIEGEIEVPAGMHAALEVAFGEAGIPAAGLWARVPHYAAAMPYPAASRALLDGLGRIADISVPSGVLLDESQQIRHRLDELVGDSPEHQQLLQALEAEYDATDRPPAPTLVDDPEELPTGDELAGQIQDFLRDRNNPG